MVKDEKDLSKKIYFLSCLDEKDLTEEEARLLRKYASEGIALAKIKYATQAIHYLKEGFDYDLAVVYLDDVAKLNLKVFFCDIALLYLETGDKYLSKHARYLGEEYIRYYDKKIPLKLERYLRKRNLLPND